MAKKGGDITIYRNRKRMPAAVSRFGDFDMISHSISSQFRTTGG
jgi:hypothetical protein